MSDIEKDWLDACEEIDQLKQERDEYREALKDILDKWNMEDVCDIAREVLKKYEGEK